METLETYSLFISYIQDAIFKVKSMAELYTKRKNQSHCKL